MFRLRNTGKKLTTALLLSTFIFQPFLPLLVIPVSAQEMPASYPGAIEAPEESNSVAPEESNEESPVWQTLENGSYQSTNPIVLGQEYVFPENDLVRITFTSLPEVPGGLTISELSLTQEQIEQTNAVSKNAYEFTTSMPNGSFEYNLTLPVPQSLEKVTVEYAENIDGINDTTLAGETTQPFSNTITLTGLDHFTVFIVTSPLGGGISNGDEVNADCSATLLGSGIECFDTIQAAIDEAVDGETINVLPGTYNENLRIDKNIILQSTGNRDNTSIIGSSSNPGQGAIELVSGTDGVVIDGFTIEGFDGTPPIERSAIYFAGNHNGTQILNNRIVANGDLAILSEYGRTITNILIDGNIIEGQSFVGSQPGGTTIDYSNAIVNPNTPRPLVYMGDGAPNATSNVTFSNNSINGVAGGISTDTTNPIGNHIVSIEASNSLISNNIFGGTTAGIGVCFRSHGENTVISGNSFECSTDTGAGLRVGTEGINSTVDSNNFDTTTTGDQYEILNDSTVVTGLAAPILISPADGFAINVLPYPQNWNGVYYAVQYEYQSCAVDPGDEGAVCSDVIYETTTANTNRTIGSSASDQLIYWRVRGVDVNGNKGDWSTSFELTIDSTDPVVTVDTLNTRDRTPELTGTITEDSATIEVSVFGNTYTAINNLDGSWSLPDDTISPNLLDATYDVSVTATDAAGNSGSDTTTDELFIDRTAPELLTLNELVSGQVFNSNNLNSFTGDVNDNGIGMIDGASEPYDDGIAFRLFPEGLTGGTNMLHVEWATIDTATNTYEVNFDPSDLPEGGPYDLRIAAYDRLGNVRSLLIEGFVVDNTDPVITITNDTEVGPINLDTFTFEVTDANPNSAMYALSEDAICDSSDSYSVGLEYTESTELNNGKYLCAYAQDLAGNEVYAISTNPLNIDATAPSVGGTVAFKTDSSDTYISGKNIRLSMTATDDSGIDYCEYSIDGGTTWLPATYNVGEEKCRINGLSVPDGDTIDAAFRVFDVAGNESTGAFVDYISDAEGPEDTYSIFGPLVNGYTNETPGILASFKDLKTNIVTCEHRYSIAGTDNWTDWEDGSYFPNIFNQKRGTCVAQFNGLDDAETYNFEISVRDEVGNRTRLRFKATTDITHPESTIENPEDNSYWNEPIEIEGSSTDLGSGVAAVSIQASVAGENNWFYVDIKPNWSLSEPFNWTHNWTPSMEGTYDIRVRAIDLVGNIENTDYAYSITYDVSTPVMTNINLFVNGTDTDLAKSGDTLRVVADVTDATSPIDYVQIWFRDYPYTGEQLDSGTMNYISGDTYEFVFVLPDTYQSGATINESELGNYFNFRPWDTAGNSVIGYRNNFTVDNTAPVVEITNPLDGAEVSGTVDVRGSVNDAHPWRYYSVVRNASNSVVAGPGTVYNGVSFTDNSLFSWDTTLLPDGEYVIHLAARDLADNRDDSAGSLDQITVMVNNLGYIQGTKFHDLNDNGLFDASERTNANRINNWEMNLYNASWELEATELSGETGTKGQYRFDDLPAGNYFLCEASEEDWYQSYPMEVGAEVIDNNGNVVSPDLAVSNESPNAENEEPFCWEIDLAVGEEQDWMRFGNYEDNEVPEVSVVESFTAYEGDEIPSKIVEATDNKDVAEICIELLSSPVLTFGPVCFEDEGSNNTSFSWDLAEILEEETGYTKFDTSSVPEGEYEIAYYVVDAVGNESEQVQFSIFLENVAPQVELNSDQSIPEITAATFTGSFYDPSTVDEGDGIFDDADWSVEIDYGDGLIILLPDMEDDGEVSIPDHVYATEGTYTVTLTVCENGTEPPITLIPSTLEEEFQTQLLIEFPEDDYLGGEGECSSASVEVEVSNVAPSVSIVANPGTSVLSGTTVELTADTSANTLPGNQIVSIDWNDDCNGGTNATYNLATPTATSYECSVVVTDIDGDTAGAVITISASNDLPSVVLIATPGVSVTEGTVVSIQGNILSGDANFSYEFSGACSGSGNNAGGLTTAVSVPSTLGNYYCRIDVTDTNGDEAAAGVTIAVNQAGSVAGEFTSTEGGEQSNEDNNDEDEDSDDENDEQPGRGTGEILGIFDACEESEKQLISGFIYQRNSEDQTLEDSEARLSGVAVFVYGFNEDGERVLGAELQTNEDGYYEVSLCNGSYEVEIDQSDLPEGAELVSSEVLAVSLDGSDADESNFVIESDQDNAFNWWWILLPLLILLILIGLGYFSQTRQEEA